MDILDQLPTQLLTAIIAPISTRCLYVSKKWNAIAEDHILEDRKLGRKRILKRIFRNNDINLLHLYGRHRSSKDIVLFISRNKDPSINYSYDMVKTLVENFHIGIDLLIDNAVKYDKDDVFHYLLDKHSDATDLLGKLVEDGKLRIKCLRLAYLYKGATRSLNLNYRPGLIMICNAGLIDIIQIRIKKVKDTSIDFMISYLCMTDRSIALNRLLQIKKCAGIVSIEHMKICLENNSYNCLYTIMNHLEPLNINKEDLLCIYKDDRIDEVLSILNKQY